MVNEGKSKPGYENYIIYENGEIYSIIKKQFLTPFQKTTGYYAVNLYSNGKAKMFFVHRLVAELFLPNPNNLPEVNHKDENKANNHISNLEWCNRIYNEHYGLKKDKEMDTKTKNGSKNGRKAVIQLTLEGAFVNEFSSMTEASQETGVSLGNISSVINGKRNHAGGYLWKIKI